MSRVPTEIIDLAFLAIDGLWLPSQDSRVRKVQNLAELQKLFPETDVYQPVVFREPVYGDDFGLYLRPIKGFSEEEVTVFNSPKVAYDCWNCNGIIVEKPLFEKTASHIDANCRECRAPLSQKSKEIFDRAMSKEALARTAE